MLASLPFRRPGTLGLALAAVLVAPPVLAQSPPDLPPVGGPAVHVAQPAPAGPPAPAAPPGPAAPKQPGPGRYVGLSPQPGWTPYPVMPYPYYYPQAAPPRQVDYRLPPPPPRRLNNPGMLAGGIVMVAGGLAAVISGAVLVSSATNRIDIYCDSPSFPCAHMDDGPRKTAGALMMAGGAIVGAIGIPLWIIGSKMVPLDNAPSQPAAPARPALVPEVRVGAGAASVTLRF